MVDVSTPEGLAQLYDKISNIALLIADSGTVNAIVLSDPTLDTTPAIVDGQKIRFTPGTTITGATTLTLTDGGAYNTGPLPVQTIDGTAMMADGLVAGQYYEAVLTGGETIWKLTTPYSGSMPGMGGGEANEMSTVGPGLSWFSEKDGITFNMKSVTTRAGGGNMVITDDTSNPSLFLEMYSKGGVHALNAVEDLGIVPGTSPQDALDNSAAIRTHEDTGSDAIVYFNPGAYAFDAERLLGKAAAPHNVPVAFKKSYMFGPGVTVRMRNDYMDNGTKLTDVIGPDILMPPGPTWLYQTPHNNSDYRYNFVRGAGAGPNIDPTVHKEIHLDGANSGANLSSATVEKITTLGPGTLESGDGLHHITAIGVKAGRHQEIGHRMLYLDSNAGEFIGMTTTSLIQAHHPYHREAYAIPPGESTTASVDGDTIPTRFANWANKNFELKFPNVRNEISSGHSYSGGTQGRHLVNFGTVLSGVKATDENEVRNSCFGMRDSGNKGFKVHDTSAWGYKTLTSMYDVDCTQAFGTGAFDNLMWGLAASAWGEGAARKMIEAKDLEVRGVKAANEAPTGHRSLVDGPRAGQFLGLTGPRDSGGIPIPANHVTISSRLGAASTILDRSMLQGPYAGRFDGADEEAKSLTTMINSWVAGVDAASNYVEKDIVDTLFWGFHESIPFLGGDLVKNQIGVAITKPQLEAFQSQPTLPGMFVLQDPAGPPNAIDISDSRSAFVAINDGDTGFTAVAGGTASVSTGSYVITRGGISSTTVLKHDYNTDITTLRSSDPQNPKIQIWADSGVEIWDGNPSTGNLILQITSGGHIVIPSTNAYSTEALAQAGGVPTNGLYYSPTGEHNVKVMTL